MPIAEVVHSTLRWFHVHRSGLRWAPREKSVLLYFIYGIDVMQVGKKRGYFHGCASDWGALSLRTWTFRGRRLNKSRD